MDNSWMSHPIGSMQLSDSGDTEPKIPQNNDSKSSNNESKTETGWKAILEYGKADDEKTIGEWKDELANLLTFTGLFSAVVTGFVALTLPMLQEDSTATSAALLAQISQQLASYSVGNQFTNSTVQPSSSLPEPFVPDQRVVRLNILWVSSLMLSVMAAFFTISVQQWLRRVPLPPHLSIREAVRLWRLRHFGLVAWKVPTIVSLLPVLVQISVVLFLVGLYFLLETLNETTARVLLVLGSSSLGLWLIMAVLPLLFITCPYKSPVIPTVVSMVQLSSVPVLAAAGFLGLIVGNFVITVIQVALVVSVKLAGFVVSAVHQVLRVFTSCAVDRDTALRGSKEQNRRLARLRIEILAIAFRFTEWVDHTWMTGIVYIFKSSTLWDRWELQYVSRRPEHLDAQVLSWAYARASPILQEDPQLLRSCLQGIPDGYRPQVGTSCVNRFLLNRHRDVSMINPAPSNPVFIHASDHLPRTVSDYEDVLRASLPDTWALYEEKESGLPFYRSVPFILCLLYRNNVLGWAPDKVPSESSVADIAGTLLAIRAHQNTLHILKYPRQRLPTALLFGCYLRGYTLSDAQTQSFISWTVDMFNTLPNLSTWGIRIPKREAYKIPLCDIVLGTLAIALMGISAPQSTDSDGLIVEDTVLQEMLKQCATFLDEHFKNISFITRITTFVPEGRHILITAQALASIANSISRLASEGRLAMSPDCPSHEVVRLLREICDRAHGDEHYDTERFLDVFCRVVEARKTNPTPDELFSLPDQFFVSIEPPTFKGGL